MPTDDSIVEYQLIRVVPNLNYRVGDDGSTWTRSPFGRGEFRPDVWRPLKQSVRPGNNSQGGGYLRVMLFHERKRYILDVHVLVLTHFVGPRPRGMVCCHRDGDRRNNRIDNLRWDTQSNNIEERKKHGTFPLGSRHRSAKLKEADIPEIRRLYYEEMMSQKKIGDRFGVCHSSIAQVLHGATWKHVVYLGGQ